MPPTTKDLDKPSAEARLLELTLLALKARISYPTRVWTALLVPVFAGSAFSWPTRVKFESLLVSAFAVVLYTIAEFVWKRFLK